MPHDRTRPVLALLLLLAATFSAAPAAEHRSDHFVVEAADKEVARQVAETAEKLRRSIARDWLGEDLPPWDDRCRIRVTVALGNTGGGTSFAFDNGKVLSQRMKVEGTLERILSSLLPHE